MLDNLKNISNRINQIQSQDTFNFRIIDIEDIEPSNKNLYGIRDIDELAADIKENGLYHNLVVREKEDGKYEIISGERRYNALKKLNYDKVPCQVKKNISDIDFEIMLIQANAKARELTNGEKLKQVERLKELYDVKKKNGEKIEGKTRDAIGKDLGMSGSQVGRYIKISHKLDDPLKEKFKSDEITMRQATKLSSFPKEQQQEKFEVMQHEEVKDEEFTPKVEDIKKLEAAAQPIKDMYQGVVDDENNKNTNVSDIESKLNNLVEYVNKCVKSAFYNGKVCIRNFDDSLVSTIIRNIAVEIKKGNFYLAGMGIVLSINVNDIKFVDVNESTGFAGIQTKYTEITFANLL